MASKRIPRLQRHPTHQCGRVRLSGRDYYLGAWPDPDGPPPPAAQAAYERGLAECLAAGKQAPAPDAALTVNQLAARYLPYAERLYVDEQGKPISEIRTVRRALAYLCRLYGGTPAATFGPLAL